MAERSPIRYQRTPDRLLGTHEVEVEAFDATHGHKVGHITAMLQGKLAAVTMIAVNAPNRRQGIARALYAELHSATCAKWKLPLSSDTLRAPEVETYWRGELERGRATCLRWRADATCERYQRADPCPRRRRAR